MLFLHVRSPSPSLALVASARLRSRRLGSPAKTNSPMPAALLRAPPRAPSFAHHRHSRPCVATRANRSLFDEILDGLEGGRKLRRWYGSDSSVGSSSSAARDDGGEFSQTSTSESSIEDVDVELDLPRRTVLVLDADGVVGEAVAARLVLAKVPVACQVANTSKGEQRFGPYCTFVSDEISIGAALNGARAVIASEEASDELFAACARRGVAHVVLASSTTKANEKLSMLFANKGERARKDRQRERRAAQSGLAVTVARAATLRRAPGGAREIILTKPDADSRDGTISVEDFAEVIARALTRPPKKGQTVCFDAREGELSSRSRDWKALFDVVAID